jgi:acyl carrier protein
MTPEDINDIVCDLFLGGDRTVRLPADLSLLEEGICDSLGLVQIATAIEQRIPGIRLRDQEVTSAVFGSLADIARTVENRRPR